MHARPCRSLPMAMLLAVSAVGSASGPAAASCIGIDQLLPDPTSPDAVVFVGTVAGLADARTNLLVDAWYLGPGAVEDIVVIGGRQVGVISSADWVPTPGERYVVAGTSSPDGLFTTGTCEQSFVTPALLEVLAARYGEPRLPPFAGSPGPSSGPTASPSIPVVPPNASPGVDPLTGSPPAVTSNDSPAPDSLVHGTPEP